MPDHPVKRQSEFVLTQTDMNAQSSASPARSVWFPDWAEALARANLPDSIRSQYRAAILQYLRFCKRTRQGATVASARQFMQDQERRRLLSGPDLAPWKAGMNWFFREGGRRRQTRPVAPRPPAPSARGGGPVLSGVPTLGAADLGKTEWERRLIQALRGRQYRWRTEQTYREWSRRFVRWLEEQGLPWETAAEAEVKTFLSDLATRQRASASAQKQALNALVFLLREALGRTLGAFGDFTRARKVTRVPVVLTREECRRLFAALEGSTQLMAQLMYGGGLRLTELLGLRIKDMDLERRQIIVRGGKGDKDRVTVLPESLTERLRAHRERLRELHTEDQRQEVPGVWLPEGLERKYPQAGRSWEWQWVFPSRQLMKDPRTGVRRRHHVLDATFQHAIRQAARRAKLDKRATPHTLRHSFATHLLESGTDIDSLAPRSLTPAGLRPSVEFLSRLPKPLKSHGTGVTRSQGCGDNAALHARDAKTGNGRAQSAGSSGLRVES